MPAFLPASWARLGLLLGLAAPALAQTPTADLLRARQPAAATTLIALPRSTGRLDAELERLGAQTSALRSRGTAPTAEQLRTFSPHLRFEQRAAGTAVQVRITATNVDALRPQLRSLGFEEVIAYPKLHFVEGLLPVSLLADASGSLPKLVSSGLLGIMASFMPQSNVGAVTSQADYVLEAARARATLPGRVSGAGVNVGVLSDSFNYLQGAAADVASGDLPTVNLLADYSASTATDEGRGMSQLVYDLAPGAGLAFSTAYGSEGVFAQHIRDLADPSKGNCKVIVDDVRYFTEPFFQDGVVAQAVTDVVTNRSVAYFSSAGNSYDRSYENTAPQFVASATGAKYLNFDVSGATADFAQRVTVANGATFRPFLQWSDPFYTSSGVKTDLDFFLVAVKNGVSGDTIYGSRTRNISTSNPLEYIDFTNNSTTTGTTTFDVVIQLKAGAVPSILKYINYGTAQPTEWLTSSSTIAGHAAAAEAFAVAAVPYYNQRTAEPFTSKGGALPFLFSPSGAPLATPTTRRKPDIASVDGTNTSFFGSDIDGDGFPNFSGTSAAAPHAAAVAALLRSTEPNLTPAQVYARLVSSARLIGTTNTDVYTGPGLLDAFTTLYGAVAPASPALAEDLEKGALPTSWSVNGTGAARAQVSNQAPASGSRSLVLDAYPTISSIYSRNEATLYLTNAASSNLALTFRERKFVAETDEAMPAQFSGTSNTDGVAMSVDGGTTWYRLVDLTGTNATTSYQTKSVNLSQFATTNNLTLGNDVRIRFQQYGRGGSTNATEARRAGRAFDDVVVVNSATPAPVPLFATTPFPTTGCPGLQVQYADTSLFKPTSYQWTFPGGTPATSTLRNPVVTYNTPGHYGVTLSVSNATGTVAHTDTGVVFIYGRAPVASIATSATSVCLNGSVTFTSTSAYCPSTYAWSFPGGTPASSTAASPTVTYSTAGSYFATLTVTNAYGSSSVLTTIEVNGRTLPLTENFESSTTLPAGWSSTSPANIPWGLADNIVGRSGNRSRTAIYPFYSTAAPVGDRPVLVTPGLNLNNVTAPTLRFEVAYATYTGASSTSADSLIIQVVDLCSGTLLGRVYAKGAATLPTATTRATSFVPASAADWRQEVVDLSAFAGRVVVLRFMGYNGYGNNLFLDNVQLGSNLLSLTSAASTVGLQAWPVPAPAGSALNLHLPAYSGALELRLLDALGRLVWHQQLTQSGGAQDRTLPLPQASGAYTLLYLPATGTPAAQKLLVE